jgi:hypothetical protein
MKYIALLIALTVAASDASASAKGAFELYQKDKSK